MKFIYFLIGSIFFISLNAQEFEEGKILIKFKKNINKSQIPLPPELKFQGNINLAQDKVGIFKVDFVGSDKNQSKRRLLKLIDELKKHPSVEIAQPNFYYYPLNEIPLDQDYNLQWGLYNDGTFKVREGVPGIKGADINAQAAWQVTKGDKNIIVALIDTGIDFDHPDLKNQMWVNKKEMNGSRGIDDDGNGLVDDIYGYDFANDDPEPFDDHGHGTHVAGTIGSAHNTIGVRGVMGNVSLMAIKYIPKAGPGTTDKALKCFDYAIRMNAKIINTSWGGSDYDPLLFEAIKWVNQKGIVMVAAAGNKGANNDIIPHYPSDYNSPNIVSVAATDAMDGLTFQSNFGSRTVHIAAPGKSIYSTLPNNRYGNMNGTSSSAGFVSGALGLLLSTEKNLSVEQIKKRLLDTSDPIEGLRRKIQKNSGRLNVYNLLKNIKAPRINESNLVWEVVPIEPFESLHPYENRTALAKTFKVPGAKYIRVTVEEYEMEKGDDFLELVSKEGHAVDRISGKGQNYISNFTQGDEIKVYFITDFINTGWGFLIKEVQVVR